MFQSTRICYHLSFGCDKNIFIQVLHRLIKMFFLVTFSYSIAEKSSGRSLLYNKNLIPRKLNCELFVINFVNLDSGW